MEVYRTLAYKRDPISVAVEFAKSYWDKPREIVNWDNTYLTFQVENGIATYTVNLDPGIKNVYSPYYYIVRL
jgi:hypothetical protein